MFCSVCSLLDGVRSSASDCIQVCRCADTFRARPRFCALKRNIRLDLPVPLTPSTNRVSPTSSRSGCRSPASVGKFRSNVTLFSASASRPSGQRTEGQSALPPCGTPAGGPGDAPAQAGTGVLPRADAAPCRYNRGQSPTGRRMVISIVPAQPPACPSHALPGRGPNPSEG